MSKKTKHHYIPACYLKGFTNEGKRNSLFWAFDVNNSKKRYKTNPNDSCVSNNYYKLEKNKEPLLIENWYAESVEPSIGEFLKDFDEINKIDPNNVGLIWLLTSLWLRSPLHRAMIEGPLTHAKYIADSIEKDCKRKGINVDKSDFLFTKDDVIIQEIKQTKIAAYYFSQYNFSILKAPEQINVITSDAPLILANKKYKVFGLATKETIVIIPLNKKTFIIGTNSENFLPMKEGTKWDIANLNTMILENSNEKVFSNNEVFYILDTNNEIISYPF